MKLLEAIRSRRSVRAYSDMPVPRELLVDIVDAGKHAPSACNLQLTEYVIVDDRALIARLAEGVTRKFLWAPAYIVLTYDSRFTVKRGAALTSLGASAQNILLAAHDRGLGACPMAGFKNDRALKEILGIPGCFRAGLIIAVGYPARRHQQNSARRLPFDASVHWNGFSDAHALRASPDISQWSHEELLNYRKRIAPVYLYEDHFNIQTFPGRTYELAYEAAIPYLPTKGNILDVLTYDGTFARIFAKKNADCSLSISDIFEYPLSIFTHHYPQASRIVFEDALYSSASPDSSYDTITIVHKLEFALNPGALFKEVRCLLKDEGLLFVSFHEVGIFKRIAYILRSFWFRWGKGEQVNVYENNPFYKIGPYAWRTRRTVARWAHEAGLHSIAQGSLPFSAHVRFGWAVYQKKSNA